MIHFKRLTKRGLALFVALVMCMGMMQLPAFATGEGMPELGSDPNSSVVSDNTDTLSGKDADASEEKQSNTGTDAGEDGNSDEDGQSTDGTNIEGSDTSKEEQSNEEGEEELCEHEWGDWKVTKDPTCETEGEKTRNCAKCEATETEPVTATGHEWDDGEAVEGGTKYTCALCGESHVLADDDDSFDTNLVADDDVAQVGEIGYTTLQDAVNAAEDGDTVTLLKDVKENVTIKNETITLNLNGKTVNGGQKGTVLTINGGNVTLTGDGTITGGHSADYTQGGGVTVTGGAAFIMESGTITDNTAKQYGSGVMVYSGTFTMDGGSITNNNQPDVSGTGGGVCVYNCIEAQSAQFIMNDGTISNNSNGSGGGVGAFHWRLSADRTSVIINGGTISGNTATNGGGVSVSTADSGGTEYRGKIEIKGGTITENTANLGGGVYSAESITKIGDAEITKNTATSATSGGGGVYVQAGSAEIDGATITGNTATYGGGIFAGHKTHDTTVTMTSGKLYGNTATSNSADVFNYQTAVITLPNASEMNVKLNGKDITGWFLDGTPRWDGTGDALGTTSGLTGTQRLIAAYKNDPVAKIVRNGGDVTFTTLQKAIDAAESGETVEVLKDCTGAALQTAKKITVNIPEGMTVSTNSGKTYALAVAGAELTITGAGTVEGSTYGVVAQKSGVLNVAGGTITTSNTPNTYGVYATSGGTVNVTGGTIKGYRAVCGLTNAAINVTGENASIDGTYAGIHAEGTEVRVLVNAGEVKGGTFGMFLSKGASATVEGTAKLSRTKDDNTGFTISLKGPGGDDDTVQHTSLTVKGGTITNTKNAAIAGNGSVTGTADARHTTITITGGTITSTESWGIYHPQVGEMTITGGTITGITGVEMRAGTLNVSGDAVITGTSEEYKYDSNSNGATTIGVGIAVSQHTTERPITAVISGGTITGHHAVVEHDLQNDPQSEHVMLKIEDGLFKATGADNVTVFSDNFVKFIIGGYFSDDLDAESSNSAKYLGDDLEAHPVSTYGGGYYNVHKPNQDGVKADAEGHWSTCDGHDDCMVEYASSKEPHTFGEWIVDTPAQVGVEGSRHHVCTLTGCGYSESETIPALPSGGGSSGGGGGSSRPNPPEVDLPEPDVPLAGGPELNKADHFAYVRGYKDETVRPEQNITREEVATIFYRLLTDLSRTMYETSSNSFTDVESDRWSNTAISTLANAGILKGYQDGTFQPGKNITRAEFAAISARFDNMVEGLENPFSDTVGHWAEGAISFSYSKGWVEGYGDNTFRPQQNITRAEVMKWVNKVLERGVDADGLIADIFCPVDNLDTKWYYYEVLEAANGHEFTRGTGTSAEKWTSLK